MPLPFISICKPNTKTATKFSYRSRSNIFSHKTSNLSRSFQYIINYSTNYANPFHKFTAKQQNLEIWHHFFLKIHISTLLELLTEAVNQTEDFFFQLFQTFLRHSALKNLEWVLNEFYGHILLFYDKLWNFCVPTKNVNGAELSEWQRRMWANVGKYWW